MPTSPLHLPPHNLKIVLIHPRIAPNTGNIARLAVATGAQLHLVRPLGFILSDKELRRSAMDYWPRLKLTVHDDTPSFLNFATTGNRWLFTTKSPRSFWDARFAPDDWLIFGSETHGLSDTLLNDHPNQTLRIAQAEGERCLNLATATGIALMEALRQLRV